MASKPTGLAAGGLQLATLGRFAHVISGQLAGQDEHLIQRQAQLGGDTLHGFQGGVAAASLDSAHVGTVEPSPESKLLLTDLGAFSQLSERRANIARDVHPATVTCSGLSDHGL